MSAPPLPAPRSDRPITIGTRLEYALVVALAAFLRRTGVDAASAIGGGFLGTVGPWLRPLARRAEDNLARAYPDWSRAQIRRTTRGVFDNLGRTAAEFCVLDAFRADADPPRVTIHGAEHARAALAGDRPAIFVSGHMANWEAMALALIGVFGDCTIVYRAANNPLVDAFIIRRRAAAGMRYLAPKGRSGGRALVDSLKAGRPIAMLVDQKLNDGLCVPFFGRDAMTAPAAARLALKYDVPIVPVWAIRRGGAYLDVFIREPIDYTPTGESSRDVEALTIAVNEAIEKEIRARPEQWLWLHRRWPKEPGAAAGGQPHSPS